jgi:multicomponent Na+:H+ antiporter subunit E
VLSNFDVARRVLSPKLDINPGIVKVRTRLKNPVGRLILANSITLTPGTLSVDIVDDHLYIHWVDVKAQDVEQASRRIAASFEKFLEVIFD